MTNPSTIPHELIRHLNAGDCVLFVGDALEGASQGARLAAALVDACDAHAACLIPSCQSGRCGRPDGCAVPLTRAAQLYESRINRQALVDFVIRCVDNTSPPTSLHRGLAELPARVIVTTAYDDRLEAALRLADRKYLAVARDTDVPFDDPGRVQVIRLHGSVSQPDSLVLTEDDAADLFGRLPTVTRILQAHFASKTLLFIGYGLSDPHFLALYRQVTGPIARYGRMAYAVTWPADPLAADRWRGKVTLIAAKPLQFLTQLTQAIRVQKVEAQRAVLPSEPYKFLDYFTREDAAIFFGRDLEADLLLSTVLAHSLTVFYGRSGTGKTSLLLARVLPGLERAGYRTAYARMLGDPTAEVKAAVRGVKAGDLAYTDGSRRLRAVLADALPPGGRLVVVLDQFEEFFVRQGEEVRRAFARELAECLRPDFGSLDVRFILSLRDDYLGALDEISGALPQDVFAHRYRLENLTREKALLAILKPAETFGLPVEEDLRDRLITDLEDQGLEPANVQIVLYRLYRDAVAQGLWHEKEKQGAGLTLARYQTLGSTRAILAGYLDEVLDDLTPEALRQEAQKGKPWAGPLLALPFAERQRGGRALLKSMVTAQQTKAAVSGQEIARGDLVARAGLAGAALDALLAYLREKRVVRKFGDEDRYELAHEVMVEKVWAWVSDDELRLLDVRDMLRREMSNWRKFGHLLTREKLELVTGCCESLALSADERELIFRSALATGYEAPYWFGRACEAGVAADAIALEGLKSDAFRTRVAAVTALSGLGDRCADSLIPMLADDYPQVRSAAIGSLERLRPDGAWRKRLKYECYVPAGEFIMGDDNGEQENEKPAHHVYLDAYYIGKYPVTNADYARYRADIKRPFDMPDGQADHPVAGNVTWYDAQDYATWAELRLTTEAEWEKAASWAEEQGSRGAGGRGRKRKYPWGDEFVKDRCNSKEAGIKTTTPVERYSPRGDSPYGCADMAGNVWEWCNDWYEYAYRAPAGRVTYNPAGPAASDYKVMRGGSYYNDLHSVRCAYRSWLIPDSWLDAVGFRVARSSR